MDGANVLLFLAFLVCALLIFATIILLSVVFRLDHKATDMQTSLLKMQELVDKVEDSRQAMDRLESRTQAMHERHLALLENIRYILNEEEDRLKDIEEHMEEEEQHGKNR